MRYRPVETENVMRDVGRKKGIPADSRDGSRVGAVHLCHQGNHRARCRSSMLMAVLPKIVFWRVRAGYTRDVFPCFMSAPDRFVAYVKLSYRYPIVLWVL